MEYNDRDIKEAAEKGETVDFKVVFTKEGMSKKGNPMITVGLSCNDSTGQRLTLMYNWLVGTSGAARFIDNFRDALDEDMMIQFEGDSWVCDMDMLKGRTGRAKLSLENGYVRAEYLKHDREHASEDAPKELVEDDLPF